MQRSNHELIVPIEAARAGKSTLNIPAMYLGYFLDQCRKHGGQVSYFHWMRRYYLPRIKEFRFELNRTREPNWNTAYQPAGQDLQKKNFSPSGTDWEEFRHVALACGVSICFLFVFLMLLESENFFSKNLTPPRGGNSPSNRPQKVEKFRKFSKLWRWLGPGGEKLHRKLQF